MTSSSNPITPKETFFLSKYAGISLGLAIRTMCSRAASACARPSTPRTKHARPLSPPNEAGRIGPARTDPPPWLDRPGEVEWGGVLDGDRVAQAVPPEPL